MRLLTELIRKPLVKAFTAFLDTLDNEAHRKYACHVFDQITAGKRIPILDYSELANFEGVSQAAANVIRGQVRSLINRNL